MGIPDGLSGSRQAAFVRKQEEKSFRGLLKLFNRACDATGRPRYEDLMPPLPFVDAATDPVPPAEVVDRLTSVSSTQDHVTPEEVLPPIRLRGSDGGPMHRKLRRWT